MPNSVYACANTFSCAKRCSTCSIWVVTSVTRRFAFAFDGAVIARARHHVVLPSPPQSDQRVGILDGDLRQQESIDRAEERRVRSDTKRQRQTTTVVQALSWNRTRTACRRSFSIVPPGERILLWRV